MRLIHTLLSLAIGFTTLCFCADQDVLTILKQQAGIAGFTTYLELFPDLIELLNNDTFTSTHIYLLEDRNLHLSVLAPTDDALNAFAANNTDVASDSNKVRALLEYHISHDTHPSATFGIAPLFPATLLTNPLYANVTGGQRVEMMLSENNEPTILSGLKKASHIVTPNIFYQGGLIHIIDSVLTIPLSFPATITGAGLDNLVAILNAGGWLDPDSIAVKIANSVPDLTIWGPNDPRFGATFTGFNGLSREALDSIFEYSAVQGTVVYSDLLKNNTKFKTMQGESVTITEANGGFYVDQARITTRDYLCANGVLQVIDQPLNPNTTGTRPAIIPEEPKKSVGGGLSSAAAAGIGIALGVLILGGGIVAALIIRTRKRRRGQMRLGGGSPRGTDPAAPGPRVRQPTRDTVELEFHGVPPPRYELDIKDEEDGTYDSRRTGTTVVELRQSPSPTPRIGPVDAADDDIRSTTTKGKKGGKSRPHSTASAGAYTLNLRGPAGSGLPPSPPNSAPRPQEIDGQERNRISIHFRGETPRHLGFQARY